MPLTFAYEVLVNQQAYFGQHVLGHIASQTAACSMGKHVLEGPKRAQSEERGAKEIRMAIAPDSVFCGAEDCRMLD